MGWEVASEAPAPKVDSHKDFTTLMDSTFGKGKWHQTGGYRTPERENELRAEGAETVAPGKLSDHSRGTPENPGAYDIVVDGLNPRQVARKLQETGADFVHFYPEGQRATQGAHLHVAVPIGSGERPATKQPAADDAWQVASEAPVAKAQPKAKQSWLGAVGESFADIPREIGKQAREANTKLNADLRKNAGSLNPLTAVETTMDALNVAGSPLTGALTSIIGRPVEKTTGINRRTVGDIASIAIPFAGEAKGAMEVSKFAKEEGISENAARVLLEKRRTAALSAPKAASTDIATTKPTNALRAAAAPVVNSHAASVGRLQKEGVFMTPGMRAGGKAKIIEDAMTSNPYVGQAYAEARTKAIESANRAVYNRALAPIGVKAPDSIPVGRQGVGYVGEQLGKAYDAILPKVVVTIDDEAVHGLAAIERASEKLGQPQQAQFKAILDQDVLHHLPIGETTGGERFKMVESDLLRHARNFKSSPDPNQRAMGHMLDDVLDVVTDAAERHSPPGTREQLKKINTGYAIFTRIQDAAARRVSLADGASPGVFSPTDLVAAVKKGDRTVRKGAFARGDALLQQFAEDASAVLPSKVADSGTATRLNVTRPGIIGAGVGGAMGGIPGAVTGAIVDQGVGMGTNAIARHLLERSAQTESPQNRNFLLAASRRLQARDYGRTAAHIEAGAGAAAGASDLGNGQ